jgi:hypothetical protein
MSTTTKIKTKSDELTIKSDQQDMRTWEIFCQSGCGKKRPLIDKYGKIRRFIHGHGVHKP